MRPFRLSIRSSELTDAFLYAGHIFLIAGAEELFAVPLTQILGQVIDRYPSYKIPLTLALIRNDWLENPQGSLFLSEKSVCDTFNEHWNTLSKKPPEHALDLKSDMRVGKSFKTTIYDIKPYAYNLFVGTGGGLLQINLNAEQYVRVSSISAPRKVFDTRTVNLSAYSGEVAISTGKNGLFHGTLWTENGELKVFDSLIEPVSFRTSWMNTNVVNYQSKKEFSYLINRTKKEIKRKYGYSNIDDDKRKFRIVEFATRKITSQDIVDEETDTHYILNSSSKYFYIKRDKSIVVSSFIKSPTGDYHLSRIKTKFDLPRLPESEPLEARIMRNGVVIEYFDSVYVFIDNELHQLMDKPVYSVRTFAGSLRHKRTICITHDEGVELFCL